MPVAKTDKGQQVFKDRSIALTPRQRSAFILFDGRRSRDEVLRAAAAMGVTDEDVSKLFELELVQETAPVAATAAPAAVPAANAPMATGSCAPTNLGGPAPSGRPPEERYRDAYQVATRLTAGLGLKGFRLNLAVEAASGFDQLAELAPKIRAAVGDEKFAELNQALFG